MYEYIARVIKVTDGDTITCTVNLGYDVSIEATYRFAKIDTPEIYHPSCEAEKIHGLEAKTFLTDLILDKDILIVSKKASKKIRKRKKMKKGKYGRWICDLYLLDDAGTDIQNLLKEYGFEKKDSYK